MCACRSVGALRGPVPGGPLPWCREEESDCCVSWCHPSENNGETNIVFHFHLIDIFSLSNYRLILLFSPSFLSGSVVFFFLSKWCVYRILFCQVWFQNRRAKWRKVKRSITMKAEHKQSKVEFTSSPPQFNHMPPTLASNRSLISFSSVCYLLFKKTVEILIHNLLVTFFSFTATELPVFLDILPTNCPSFPRKPVLTTPCPTRPQPPTATCCPALVLFF